MSAASIKAKAIIAPDVGSNDSAYVDQIVLHVRSWLCSFLRLKQFPDGTSGTSVSAASAATDLESALGTKFFISVDFGDSREVEITLAGLTTGSLIATELQAQIRAAVDATDVLFPLYAGVTATFNASDPTDTYTIASPTRTESSSIRIFWQSDEQEIARDLKLSPKWGGIEERGSSFEVELEDIAASMVTEVYRAAKLAPESYRSANSRKASLKDVATSVLQPDKWPAITAYARLGF